jgi:hypothetical protein
VPVPQHGGRPPAGEHLGHVLAQARVVDQLASPLPAALVAVVCGDREVPAVLLHLAEQVAPDLAVDGGVVATEPVGDLALFQLAELGRTIPVELDFQA